MLSRPLTKLVRRPFAILRHKKAVGAGRIFARREALLGIIVPVLLAMTPVHAGVVNGNAISEISESLSIIRVDDLDFGRILPSAVVGRVVINQNNGNCAAQAGATLIGTDCHRAQFVATGAASQFVAVAIDAAPITLSRTGGGATMTMDRLSMSGGPNKRLDGTGQLIFYAGGRLQVGADQAPGFYEATFNVSVEYQ
jgi:hypothetical protein